MNPEHFTDKTNELLGKARELALDSAHVQITPIHLALALISTQKDWQFKYLRRLEQISQQQKED